MATQAPPPGKPPAKPGAPDPTGHPSRDIELLKVIVSRDGQKVSAQWAIHPQIKHDLQPAELKEVTELMAKITGIVGTRFAQVLAEAEPDKPGTA
jgi:5,10-methylenetetrahydrofolate reductase